jgi:hypothetical protein
LEIVDINIDKLGGEDPEIVVPRSDVSALDIVECEHGLGETRG